jgi:hypothetical protein
MNIRPTQPGQTPQTGPGSLKESGGTVPVRPEDHSAAKPADTPPDSVQLSAAVRDLQARLGLEQIPVSELTPERLREVLSRVASGHYDRPEVIEELARRLASETDPARTGE